MRKEYCGGGISGQLSASLDEVERLQKKEEAIYWKEEQERLKRSAEFLRVLEEAVEVLTRAELLVSGCHQHKGQWRRRRGA